MASKGLLSYSPQATRYVDDHTMEALHLGDGHVTTSAHARPDANDILTWSWFDESDAPPNPVGPPAPVPPPKPYIPIVDPTPGPAVGLPREPAK